MYGARSRLRAIPTLVLLILTLPAALRGTGSSAQTPLAVSRDGALPAPDHYVLTNRQKYIGLTAYFPGVEYDAVQFSVIRQPQNGRLYGTPPNLLYVPNSGFAGADSFVYQATFAANTFRRTVTLLVDPTYSSMVAIPAPPFGINESHWMYAGQMFDYGGRLGPYKDAGNGPYTHFVDFNIGSDASNPYGSAANPRKSIPANLPAGSVVELHGQNITTQPRYVVSGNGTLSRPIFIRGAGPTQKPIFRRPMSVESSNIIFENLEFDGRDFGPGTTGANWFWVTNTETTPYRTFSRVCLRHSIIRDQPAIGPGENPAGVVMGVRHFDPALNDPTLRVENIVVYDVEIRNFGQWNDFSGTEDHSGCLITANARSCWILDCHFHHLRGPGVSPSRTGALPLQTSPTRVYIGRNYIHNCKETAVSFKNALSSIFCKNVCHTFRKSSSSPGFAVVVVDDDPTPQWPGSDEIWVLFNTIYDSESGIWHELRNASTLAADKHSRSYIVGNLLFDIRLIRGSPDTAGVAIHKGQLAESRIVGNTIYNCDHGIWAGFGALVDPSHTTQVIRNNLIADLTERFLATNGMHAMHIYVTPSSILPYTTIDHNLHFEGAGQQRFTIAHIGQLNFNYYSVFEMYVDTGFGAASPESNPLFANLVNLDFRPVPGSDADGSGTSDEVYNLFLKQFGRSIDFYLDGSPRPPDVSMIGAFPLATGAGPWGGK